MENNIQQELLDLYNKLLKEQVHFIKQIYHQMFSADLMRINPSKKVYRLQTNYDYVKETIRKLTNLS